MSADHWLHRLDEHGWLAAADAELEAGHRRVGERRAAVAHARRACGMALNAVLVAWSRRDPDVERELPWGRSYVDHLRALTDGRVGPLAAETAELARAVLATPMAAPVLVALGRRHADIEALLEHTRALLTACTHACGDEKPAL